MLKSEQCSNFESQNGRKFQESYRIKLAKSEFPETAFRSLIFAGMPAICIRRGLSRLLSDDVRQLPHVALPLSIIASSLNGARRDKKLGQLR